LNNLYLNYKHILQRLIEIEEIMGQLQHNGITLDYSNEDLKEEAKRIYIERNKQYVEEIYKEFSKKWTR